MLRDQEQLASIALYGLSARRQCGRLVSALEVGVLRPLQPPDLAAAGGTVGPSLGSLWTAPALLASSRRSKCVLISMLVNAAFRL